MALLHKIVRRLEGIDWLDKLAEPLIALVQRAVRPQPVTDLLSGARLGHPLHPMLTDLPIGAWSMSAVLDATGRPDTENAADLLVGAGILTALPTAASGWNDWSHTIGGERRIGVVHAAANTTALGLYTASLIARRTGNRRGGKALGLAGFAVLMVGGYLGGYLSFGRAVNVNHTAFEHRPDDWTPVLDDAELPEGQHRTARAGEASVLLSRQYGQVLAIANTCSHAGGPLNEGQLADGCVTCPWHSSIFRLTDGSIVRGPASNPQPAYDTRIRDGHIEVRARS